MIREYQARHRFHDRNRSGDYAGIVPAFAFEEYCIAFSIHARLAAHQGGYRLECDVEQDILAVADTALQAAATVGDRADGVALFHIGIVVL